MFKEGSLQEAFLARSREKKCYFFSFGIRGQAGKAHIFSTFLDHFSLEILIQRNDGERRGEEEAIWRWKERGKGRRRWREGTRRGYPL